MATHRSYSPLRRHGDLAFTSGILGRGDDGELVAGGVVAEFAQALATLDRLLAEAGANRADVLRLVVYLTDIDDIVAMDEVFREHFAEPRPTRTCVQVAALPGGATVEAEATIALAGG